MPNAAALVSTIFGYILGTIVFIVTLFLKLCFSTALYATLAEIQRRIQVFRQQTRVTIRAVLLLPTVLLFCSAVLLLLWTWGILSAGLAIADLKSLGAIAWAVVRVVFLGLCIVAGGLLGWMTGQKAPMGKDRFGGILMHGRRRYLGFWVGAFAVCGFFRLMPWGFITYWTVCALAASAAVVCGAHWMIYTRFRSLVAKAAPGLPPGERLDLKLTAEEAVILSAVVRSASPLAPEGIAAALGHPDPAWLAHPAWFAAVARLAADPTALTQALTALQQQGLIAGAPYGWAVAGKAARLQALRCADTVGAVTIKANGRAVTRVLQWCGPSTMLVEPGPETLRIRELAPGDAGWGELVSE